MRPLGMRKLLVDDASGSAITAQRDRRGRIRALAVVGADDRIRRWGRV